MGFSKGPWVVKYGEYCRPYVEASGGSICSIGPCSGTHEWVPAGEDESNARLIAAAPAMLEMLLRVRREVFEYGTYESLKEDLDAMLEQLTARVGN